jgi:hypothetical protein
LGHHYTSKHDFTVLWSNTDSELSQEIDAQKMAPATAACKKLEVKSLPLKLDHFCDESPRRDW